MHALLPAAPDDEFVGFVEEGSQSAVDLSAPNFRLRAVRLSAPPARAASAEGSRSPRDMLRLTRAVRQESLDLFFSPSVYTYFPLPPSLRSVVTIHDAIAERFPHLTLPSIRARLFWKAKVRLAIWQARLVATVSEFSADELTSVLGVPRSRIRVTGEAPTPVYAPSESAAEIRAAAARAGVPEGASWFTYVGGFNPHKHVDVIVRAHADVVATTAGPAPHLVLVGTTDADVFHHRLQSIRDAIDEAGTKDLVHWTGFVPDVELRHLHSGAVALLLPSECEGFGLPAVEAAACATPVIATTRSPLPTLLDGGGIFVPPRDRGALASAMRALLTDGARRRTMGQTARNRAAELTWARSAGNVIEALYEAAA